MSAISLRWLRWSALLVVIREVKGAHRGMLQQNLRASAHQRRSEYVMNDKSTQGFW